MANTSTSSLTKRELRSLHTRWRKGQISKFAIERDVLGVTTGRGKTITRLWQNVLGLDTVNVAR